jgi:hypothetical protein
MFTTLRNKLRNGWATLQPGPHLRTPNPGFNPGFTPSPHLLYKRGVNPPVEPGVWRPEIWAQKRAHCVGRHLAGAAINRVAHVREHDDFVHPTKNELNCVQRHLAGAERNST